MASLPDRPRALTDEVQGKILAGLRLGTHFTTACFAAGIQPTSVTYWIKLVESGAEHAQVYADFCNRIKEAIAIAETQGLATLKMGEQGWQAQAWFLERRFPQRWGKRDKVEHVGNPNAKTTVEVKFTRAKPATDEDPDD